MTLSDWTAKTLQGEHGVRAVTVDGVLLVATSDSGNTMRLLPTDAHRVTVGMIPALLAESPDAIVVVPSSCHYDWAARELAVDQGSVVLTYGEAVRALALGHRPASVLARPVAAVRDAMAAHSKVQRVGMICERTMRLTRSRGLPDVTLAVDEQYEFSAEAVIDAVNLHPDVDIICDNNPNGRVTSSAIAQAEHSGVEVLKRRDLFSRLHRR